MKIPKWRYALCSTLLTLPLLATAQTANLSPPPTFAISEHITLGNEVLLSFDANDPGHAGTTLHLSNGIEMTYGEALSMGDFYAIIGKPISKGNTEAERKERFIAAFNTFATSSAAIEEVHQLLALSTQEASILDERMKNGEAPEAIFKSISSEMGRQFNCATGGGCGKNTWWSNPGRYLDIARENYDHFGDDAISAYKAGHEAALDQALIAHQTGDRSQLELAYAMNAFACHFLSDRFAAGHIRTPRNELAEHVTPELVGSLLAGYMHGEENEYGLHVHNNNNDEWVAYGDWYYFNTKNAISRSILHKALQESTNAIFNAYLSGQKDQVDITNLYIPIPDETKSQSHYDIAPLFYWDENTNTLMRRTVLSDPFNYHWTSSWWGWSTLAELREQRS